MPRSDQRTDAPSSSSSRFQRALIADWRVFKEVTILQTNQNCWPPVVQPRSPRTWQQILDQRRCLWSLRVGSTSLLQYLQRMQDLRNFEKKWLQTLHRNQHELMTSLRRQTGAQRREMWFGQILPSFLGFHLFVVGLHLVTVLKTESWLPSWGWGSSRRSPRWGGSTCDSGWFCHLYPWNRPFSFTAAADGQKGEQTRVSLWFDLRTFFFDLTFLQLPRWYWFSPVWFVKLWTLMACMVNHRTDVRWERERESKIDC